MNMNATLFGQLIAFLLFWWFCAKFIWPPLVNALAERKKKIAEGLAAAERGHHEKELAEQRAADVIREAKAKAAEILNQAQKRANEVEEEGKEKGRSEGERMKTAALAEIEQETNRAREALRTEVVTLALQGAEKVLEKEINADVHSEYLNKLAANL